MAIIRFSGRSLALWLALAALPAWAGERVIPLSRHAEKVVQDDGSRSYRVYPAGCPHYYRKAGGGFDAIDLESSVEDPVSVPQYVRRGKNVREAGFRMDTIEGDVPGDNFIVLRPDGGGKARMSISLGPVRFDGEIQNMALKPPVAKAPEMIVMGAVKAIATRRGLRVLVPAENKIDSFEVVFYLSAQNCRVETHAGEYWFRAADTGELFVRLANPVLLDEDFEPLCSGAAEPGFGSAAGVSHLLTATGENAWTYTKFSNAGFAGLDPPKDFFIDVDAVYGEAETYNVIAVDDDPSYSFAETREAPGGALLADSGRKSTAIGVTFGGGPVYYINRTIEFFDLSGLAGTVTAASVFMHGYAYAGSDVCAQLSTATPPLAAEDFQSMELNSGAWGTKAPWQSAQWNCIAVNETGLADITAKLGRTLAVAFREYSHDYLNQTPLAAELNGAYFSTWTGTSYDPYLEMTIEPPAGGGDYAAFW